MTDDLEDRIHTLETRLEAMGAHRDSTAVHHRDENDPGSTLWTVENLQVYVPLADGDPRSAVEEMLTEAEAVAPEVEQLLLQNDD